MLLSYKKRPLAQGKRSIVYTKIPFRATLTIFLSQPLWTKLKGVVTCSDVSHHFEHLSLFIVLNPTVKVNIVSLSPVYFSIIINSFSNVINSIFLAFSVLFFWHYRLYFLAFSILFSKVLGSVFIVISLYCGFANASGTNTKRNGKLEAPAGIKRIINVSPP